MAEINWEQLWAAQNGAGGPRRRYQGANVFFFDATVENKTKSEKEGRPIFDEVPSISIQWPGQDVTVRRVEPRDVQEYPDKWAAYRAGNEPVESGTPLREWSAISAGVVKELAHLGFKTVEQLSEASDEVRRRLGTSGRYIKMAKDWLEAANSPQVEVMKLQEKLDQQTKRSEELAHRVEILLQRIEANEGTDLRSERTAAPVFTNEIEDSFDSLEEVTGDQVITPMRRGRPRKV